MATKEEALTRSVDKIYPSPKELDDLLSKRKIRVYLGIDPTGNRLHLGHTVPLRKLQEFADLGNEAILVIGTGTVLVGDPSQRAKGREIITEGDIKSNIETWKKQAAKVLNFSKVKIKVNGDWLNKLTLKEIAKIGSQISATQLFKREMFHERLERGDVVWYHETLYPLLQGYDSVKLDTDLEIGGTDQTFNMLIGRELMQKLKNKEKFVLTVPMILGTDGQPMSKTSGNCVWLDDSPQEMYGKLMAMPDAQVDSYLELVTDLSKEEFEESKKLKALDKKKVLAFAVVKMYHGVKLAEQTAKDFMATFTQKETPADAPIWPLAGKKVDLTSLLLEKNLMKSKSEVRRLISQGGVQLNDKRITQAEITLVPGILKIGKRTFIKIK